MRRQKVQRNLWFVKSPSVQVFPQFKSKCWSHCNDCLELKCLFTLQLSLNPNRCADPKSLRWPSSDGYLPRVHVDWTCDMTFISLYRHDIKCKSTKRHPKLLSSILQLSFTKRKSFTPTLQHKPCQKMRLVCSPPRSKTPRRRRRRGHL